MKGCIIGMGEIGTALYNILRKKHDTAGIDLYRTAYHKAEIPKQFDVMNVCLRVTPELESIINSYAEKYEPKLIIIHSTVPVGFTEKIKNAVHSPVNGRHPHMENGLSTSTKWVGADNNLGEMAVRYLSAAGLKAKLLGSSRTTELAKILCLTRYGMYLTIFDKLKVICDSFGVDFNLAVKEWETDYNRSITKQGDPQMRRPVYYPPNGKIGGHCTIRAMELLNEQIKDEWVKDVLNEYVEPKKG